MNEQIIHTFASVIMEIAYLSVGIILCMIGKGLLEKGISGKFQAEGEVVSKKFRIITSSPGLVFLIAGLVIVVSAIYSQVEFKQTTTKPDNVKNETEKFGQNTTTKSDLVNLVQVMTTYKLVASSEEQQFANQYYTLAIQNAETGNWNAATEYLVRLISIEPSRIEMILREQKLNKILQNQLFITLAHARLNLVLQAQREQPLSAEAMAILAKLNIFAKSFQHPSDISKTNKIIANIPTSAGQESNQKTLESIKSLLKENPKALHNLLTDRQYRWIYHDPLLFEWLQKSGDSYFLKID